VAFRYPGQSILFGPNRITANELNRTSEQVERAERSRLGLKNRGSEPEYLTWWVWVRNDTGADRKRFECVSLAAPIMDLELDGSVDMILSAELSDPTKTPAILIDEIADGELGRAVGYGCALALVEAGSGQYAVPNGSSTLDPADSGPFKLIGAADESAQSLVPVLWTGGSQAKRDIEYTIESIEVPSSGHYTGLVVATVTVTESGDASLIGETKEVVDHAGCVFDLPEGDLIGVHGWGTERYAISLDSTLPPGTITPLHFSADDRCCTAADGGPSGGGFDSIDGGTL
jgi:hypothetical protein